MTPRDPSAAFTADEAPASVVGVLQWTSAALVEEGRGPGSWDFVDLDGWASGDMSRVVTELGEHDSDIMQLTLAVSHQVGHPIELTPGTWVFSGAGDATWWTAPLLVAHRTR